MTHLSPVLKFKLSFQIKTLPLKLFRLQVLYSDCYLSAAHQISGNSCFRGYVEVTAQVKAWVISVWFKVNPLLFCPPYCVKNMQPARFCLNAKMFLCSKRCFMTLRFTKIYLIYCNICKTAFNSPLPWRSKHLFAHIGIICLVFLPK